MQQLHFSFVAPAPALSRYKIRQCLRNGVVPSEPWVDVASSWLSRMDRPRGPAKTERLLLRHEVFPPGGRDTGMVRCPECGHWFPPYYIAAGCCQDCRAIPDEQEDEDAPGWDYSAKWRAIGAMARFAEYWPDVPLPSEAYGALLLEIREYQSGGRIGKVDWYEREPHWSAWLGRRKSQR